MIPRTDWYEHVYRTELPLGEVVVANVVRRPSQQLARSTGIREVVVRPSELLVGDGTATEWAEALFDLHTAGQGHADVRAHYLVTGAGEVVEGRDLAVTCGAEDLMVIVVEPAERGDYTDEAKAAVRALVADVSARVAAPVFFPAGGAWDSSVNEPEPAELDAAIAQLTVKELRAALEDAGLPTGGSKDELRDRLTQYDREAAQVPSPPEPPTQVSPPPRKKGKR